MLSLHVLRAGFGSKSSREMPGWDFARIKVSRKRRKRSWMAMSFAVAAGRLYHRWGRFRRFRRARVGRAGRLSKTRYLPLHLPAQFHHYGHQALTDLPPM